MDATGPEGSSRIALSERAVSALGACERVLYGCVNISGLGEMQTCPLLRDFAESAGLAGGDRIRVREEKRWSVTAALEAESVQGRRRIAL